MRMKSWMGASLVSLAVLVTGCSGNVATGALSTGETPAAENYRVVSTTVAATQFTDALELDLVGIPTSSKVLPKRYDGVTKVGNPMTPNMEIVKSLDPTEVLSVTTLEYDLAPVFKNAGITQNFSISPVWTR